MTYKDHRNFILRYIIPVLLLLSIAGCSFPKEYGISKHGYLTGAGGDSLYYEIRGASTDTLIIIHGGPGAGMYSFLPSAEALSEYFTLIFYDQRGGGKSVLPADTNELRPGYYTADLDSVRAHFGLKKMDVIAHSFGAVLLAEYAQIHPERLGKIILHGATGPVRADAGNYYREKARELSKLPKADSGLVQKSSELLGKLLQGKAESPMQTCKEYEELTRKIAQQRKQPADYQGTTCKAPPQAIKYYYQYTAQLAPSYFGDWDYTGTLEDISSPVLILYGERDSLGIPMQKQWKKVFPRSELKVVPEAGKGVLSGNPDYAIPEIVAFLKGE